MKWLWYGVAVLGVLMFFRKGAVTSAVKPAPSPATTASSVQGARLPRTEPASGGVGPLVIRPQVLPPENGFSAGRGFETKLPLGGKGVLVAW